MMALINRFEIVNYLDKTDEAEKWQPNFRLLLFDMMGLSSLIRMDNGQGKTSMASTLYLLLTRNRTLATEVKSKMSPSGLSSWSHIRVEVVINDDNQPLFVSAGAAVTGETWVFGVCGHRDEGLKFYYYNGILEDLSPAKRQGGKTTYLTNKEFVERQKLLGGVIRWEPSLEDYQDHLNNIFPPRAFDLGLDLHLRGGAENDDIFPIEGKHPESELFYKHIAPHLLAPDVLIDDISGDDEYFFEDIIINSASKFGEISIRAQKEREKVETLEKTIQLGSRLKKAAKNAKERHAKAKESRKGLDTGLVVLDRIVQEQAIPGIPNNAIPEGPIGVFVSNLAWHIDGKELCLLDSGVAQLTLTSISILNQAAGPQRSNFDSFPKEKKRLVLSPNTALSLEKQERGKVYPLESVQKIFQQNSRGFLDGLSLQEMQEILLQASQWWRDHVDTNPARKEVHRLQVRINSLEDKITTLNGELISLRQKEIETRKALDEVSHFKTAWDTLKGSGLFTQEELEAPALLGVRVKDAHAEATTLLNSHKTLREKLVELEPQYSSYQQLFPEIPPCEAATALSEEKQKLKGQVEETKKLLQQAKDALFNAKKQSEQADKALSVANDKNSAFKSLEAGVQLFQEVFGDISPKNLSSKVRKELSSAEQSLASLNKEKELLAGQVNLVKDFNQQHPDTDCAEFLSENQSKAKEIQRNIDALQQKSEDCAARLTDLRQHKLAPSRTARMAIDLVTPPHTVHDIITELNLEENRAANALYSLSAVLFAPVFNSSVDAKRAIEALEEKQIPVPVFLKDDLVNYVQNYSFRNTEGLYSGVFSGLETLTAATILNPDKIHTLIEQAVGELNRLEEQIKSLERDKRPLDEQISGLSDVQKAITANVLEKDMEIDKQTRDINKNLPQFKQRASDEALQAISDRSKYDQLGGDTVARAITQQIEPLKDAKMKADQDKGNARRALEGCDESLESAQSEYNNFMETWADKNSIILSSIEFLDKEGPGFLSSADQEEMKRTKAVEIALARLPFNFDKAQSFLDSGKVTLDLSAKLEEIGRQITAKSSEVDGLAGEEKKQQKQYEKTKTQRDALDAGIAGIIALWKDFYDAIQEFTGGMTIRSFNELRSVIMEKGSEDLKLFFIATDNISKHTREGLDGKGIRKDFIIISDALIGYGDKIDKVRRHQSEWRTAEEALKDECLRYDDVAKGLSANERDMYNPDMANFDDVLELFGHLDTILLSEKKRLTETEKALDVITSKAHERLAQLLEFARDNRRLLKRVASRTSEGTILIEDTMIEDDALLQLIQDLLRFVERELHERKEKENHDSRLKTLRRSDKRWRQNLRNQIAEAFYRGVFPTAKVKVQHPSVRGGKPVPFMKKGVSSGERLAIALVIIGKLQEFIQEREQMTRNSQGIRRRKKGKTQGILLLDGIFSKLSQKEMIQVAMDAYRGLKGRFQLIGLNHYPVENDEDVFPNFFEVRKVSTTTGGFLILDQDYNPVPPESHGIEMGELVAARTTILAHGQED